MDIAVINLATQPGRWEHTRRQFEALGLQALRHEAVPGHLLPVDERSRLYDPELNRRQYHKPLQPGEIGCYASHQALWRQLVHSGARMMAVFEDDIVLDAALPRVLARVAEMDLPFDMIKLYGRTQEAAHQRLACMPGFELLRYRRVPSHTCAYVLSRRGAHKLLASRRPFGRPVDIDLRHWWENELVVLGLHPYPVKLADSARRSGIESRRGCSGLGMRLHKLALQARYTFGNWQALRRLDADAAPAVPAANGLAGATDTAARRDVA